VLTHQLETYGLVLVFLLVAVEGAGIPLPGETALITAAFLASRGHFSIEAVIAVAAIGAILGDNTGYWLGRLGGRRLLHKLPVVHSTVERVLPRAERFFHRHGAKTVLIARFVALLRITAAWMAGISHMRWLRFFAFDAVGCILWATTFGIVGYVFGQAAAKAVAHYGVYAAVAIVILIIAGFSVLHFRRRFFH
jgi:membrane protein DedA with SNARE-associated domain